MNGDMQFTGITRRTVTVTDKINIFVCGLIDITESAPRKGNAVGFQDDIAFAVWTIGKRTVIDKDVRGPRDGNTIPVADAAWIRDVQISDNNIFRTAAAV